MSDGHDDMPAGREMARMAQVVAVAFSSAARQVAQQKQARAQEQTQRVAQQARANRSAERLETRAAPDRPREPARPAGVSYPGVAAAVARCRTGEAHREPLEGPPPLARDHEIDR